MLFSVRTLPIPIRVGLATVTQEPERTAWPWFASVLWRYELAPDMFWITTPPVVCLLSKS